jgi:hypothetical protein
MTESTMGINRESPGGSLRRWKNCMNPRFVLTFALVFAIGCSEHQLNRDVATLQVTLENSQPIPGLPGSFTRRGFDVDRAGSDLRIIVLGVTNRTMLEAALIRLLQDLSITRRTQLHYYRKGFGLQNGFGYSSKDFDSIVILQAGE